MRRLVIFVALAGCQEVHYGSARGLQDVTYDIHCAKKYDAAAAVASGATNDLTCKDWFGAVAQVVDGCLSPGVGADLVAYPHAADQMRLGTVSFSDGRPYPGDADQGYSCCVCAVIDQALGALGGTIVRPDGGLPQLVVQPPPVLYPVAGTFMMSDDNLWSVNRSGIAFMLEGGQMVLKPTPPVDWPTEER